MTDAIHQWIVDQAGIPAIWRHPNARKPAKPYAALQIISIQRVGRSYVGPVDENGVAEIAFDREVVVSISVFEPADEPDPRKAIERTSALRDSLELPSVRSYLADNGWGVRAIEMLSDAPQMVGSKWQGRAVFDVRFGTRKTLLEDLGLIETATVSGSVSGSDSTYDLGGQ